MKKLTKNIYQRLFQPGFFLTVVVLALLRLACPGVAGGLSLNPEDEQARLDSLVAVHQLIDRQPRAQRVDTVVGGKAHRVAGGFNYEECFPDSQAVQVASAELLGVSPVQNREEAEQRMDELVYIGSCPYFELRDLTMSVPYLVPSAALLLQDIGRNFMDSVYSKNLPPCKPYVTSVTRSKDDVSKLQKNNKNATTNSCHLRGTTFDVSYVRYYREGKEDTWDDRYRRIMAEVLQDLRNDKRCWVKYERHQPVFHITVR